MSEEKEGLWQGITQKITFARPSRIVHTEKNEVGMEREKQG